MVTFDLSILFTSEFIIPWLLGVILLFSFFVIFRNKFFKQYPILITLIGCLFWPIVIIMWIIGIPILIGFLAFKGIKKITDKKK